MTDDKSGLLQNLLGKLPETAASKLAQAIEMDRLMDGRELPHEVILKGLQGLVINGTSYPTAMPPFAAALNDADIANIANHERSSWGNQGKLITADQVKAARGK